MRPLSLLGNDLGIHLISLGLAGLAVAPLEEPFFSPLLLRTRPVMKPIAKNAKYIMAAGCVMALGKTGGIANVTFPWLCNPINTRRPRTAIAKIVFKNSFI